MSSAVRLFPLSFGGICSVRSADVIRLMISLAEMSFGTMGVFPDSSFETALSRLSSLSPA